MNPPASPVWESVIYSCLLRGPIMQTFTFSAGYLGMLPAQLVPLDIILTTLTMMGTVVAAYAAYLAATAAQTTARETRASTEAHSRAYVFPSEVFVIKVPSAMAGQFGLYAGGFLKNTGPTPAFDMRNTCRVDWGALEMEENRFSGPDAAPTSRDSLGPGICRRFGRDIEFGELEPFDFVAGKVVMDETLWVRGAAEYQDVFGQWWRVEYCWYLKNPQRINAPPRTAAERTEDQKIGMTVCSWGNSFSKITGPSFQGEIT